MRWFWNGFNFWTNRKFSLGYPLDWLSVQSVGFGLGGIGLMEHPQPFRSWQGTLYIHNGKSFQMWFCSGCTGFIYKIITPTHALGSHAHLVTVAAADVIYFHNISTDFIQPAQFKNISKWPCLLLHGSGFCTCAIEKLRAVFWQHPFSQ